MNTRSITGIIVLGGIMTLAVFIGVQLVTAQLETIAFTVGGLALLICLLLGPRIWMILPFSYSISLTFRIPGQPTTELIAQLLFIGFTLLMLMIRKVDLRFRIGELECWVIAIILMVLQVYFRNPVGVGLLGGDTVGGKAYALFAIACVVFFLLSAYRISEKELYWYLWFSIIGGILSFSLAIFGRIAPSVGFWYGAGGGATEDIVADPGALDSEKATRISFLGSAARNISLWVSAFISPLHALLKPHWLILILITIAFAAMSGFRVNILWVGLTYCVALLYRGGFAHIAASAVLGAFALAFLAFTNAVAPLPLNAQRALSFLPGTWDSQIKYDAQVTADWRFEIWKEVLLSDRWITNKWFGDGLGFSRQELELQIELRDTTRRVRSISGLGNHQDAILASADYHSGPVQTIRIIGYVGLGVLLLAMFRLGVHAHRLMRAYRHTTWFPLVLFVGLPCIFYPLFFVFVFGNFQIGSITFLTSAAMVRVLQRNLPAPGRDGVAVATSPHRVAVNGREMGPRMTETTQQKQMPVMR